MRSRPLPLRPLACVLLTIVLIFAAIALRPTKADVTPPPTPTTTTELTDQIMDRVGHNQIDQAIGLMDGLKDKTDLRQELRDELVLLHDNQGNYHGYDLAGTQRFTPQLQTQFVLANYDLQPVLLRFHFYRTQADAKWQVLGFQVTTSPQEITEILKDTPVDYVGRK